MAADGTSIKEQRLRSVSSENLSLRAELEAALKAKENALIENRRIQEELATCIAEGRKVHKDLEIAKRQIEDLKIQLQHYVAEVKRTEDLISQKESERNELLDQFRNLTDEAAHLESSNHSLVSEATQSRVQLSVALEHANDLEKRLGDQEAVVMAYEKQIAQLTSQVACLEIEVKKERVKNDKLESELASSKALCAKLDQQKDSLSRKLSEHSEMASELNRLRRDGDSLRDILSKDRNNVEHLEKLLSESRQEAVNLKLLNQELQSEIQRLKSKTEELQSKLLKCLSEHNRDIESVFTSPSTEATSRKNEKHTKNSKPGRNTIVEVEVAETVTVRNNNKAPRKATGCCCCPPTFISNNARSHVCYCPLYDVKHVLCPGMAGSDQEDCGCGNKANCCIQPFMNRCVTYSLCPNDSTPPQHNNVRE